MNKTIADITALFPNFAELNWEIQQFRNGDWCYSCASKMSFEKAFAFLQMQEKRGFSELYRIIPAKEYPVFKVPQKSFF